MHACMQHERTSDTHSHHLSRRMKSESLISCRGPQLPKEVRAEDITIPDMSLYIVEPVQRDLHAASVSIISAAVDVHVDSARAILHGSHQRHTILRLLKLLLSSGGTIG